jgi:hypothetical protein
MRVRHGVWEPATTGHTPGAENAAMLAYLSGGFVKKM